MSDAPAGPPPRPSYRERLLPGALGWLGAVGAGAVAGIALWPLSPTAGVVVGVLVAVAAVVALAATSPVVQVVGGELHAGRAHVPARLLGELTALDDPEEMRAELGPRLDARAYVCLRAWARTGIKAVLEDPADPTPYWVVSTRRPAELVAAVERARHAGPGAVAAD
ncbi:DUF3093 domain-containing protein [Isoptericola variabilis]|uniref:Alanine rich transmembrane protein n=1 Tax=Isoptericola variabilis (strain 225) TaxID=743718 RepID=F6FWF7_ISOV2|nr:DUF3093 domain-containing protein [Isoptericola variabilis]AEG44531.1 hypothetical protein Isova_1784 [Isoptericola variabilis 225]TWH26553.1 Protein of unknown function (DUF3093) [Isoptericola variabilis J7]